MVKKVADILMILGVIIAFIGLVFIIIAVTNINTPTLTFSLPPFAIRGYVLMLVGTLSCIIAHFVWKHTNKKERKQKWLTKLTNYRKTTATK